jgi:hypothetical protein
MAADHDDTEIRRYLLGELEEERSAALEQDYFAREELFDRVWAAENDIVDEYLAGRLSVHQRERFERHYMASPEHRDRVATARELRAHGVPSPATKPARQGWWTTFRSAFGASPAGWTAAAAAALVVLAVAGGVWIVRSSSRAQPSLDVRSPESVRPAQPPPDATGPAAPRAPVTIALTLSAINLRGTDDAASLVIPPGTDLVVLQLELDRGAPRFERGRASVRTLAGKDIWTGPAVAGVSASSSFARIDVPAGALSPDDYIVALFDTAAGAGETARYRYFLRVRSR